MSNENMDESLKEMNPESREKALRIAHKYQIEEDDPIWALVGLTIESVGGVEKIAQSLRAASVKVTEATRDEVKAARDKARIEIEKMQEDVKIKVAAALEKTLETEIRGAVNQLKSQSNRPLHKKWMIGMGVGIVVALGLGGWGFWDFSEYKEKVGEAKMSAVLDSSEDFSHFMKCNEPGWKKQWTNNTEGKKVLACIPYPDSKGNTSGWMITP
jgi:hypothetical protein